MENLIRRGEAQDLLKCYTQKNNLGHTPYEIVSNLPAAGPKWTAVEERLPAEKGNYIVYLRTHKCEAISHWNPDLKLWNIKASVSHWMPLPEPPEENSNE